MFEYLPGEPPPDVFPGGPHDEPAPMRPEWKMVMTAVLVLLMTLCVITAVRLLKKPVTEPVPGKAPEPATTNPIVPPATIRFKTDYKTVTVALDDIRYIESMSEYIKIYLDSQTDPLIVLYSLKRLVEELPQDRFMRIHRSYIVALDRIREASATSVVLDSPVTLPVGESYRPAFREYLRSK